MASFIQPLLWDQPGHKNHQMFSFIVTFVIYNDIKFCFFKTNYFKMLTVIRSD